MNRSFAVRRGVVLVFLLGAGLAALPSPDPAALPSPRAPLTALFIQAPSGSGGDVYSNIELQNLGYTVTLVGSDSVKASDAAGKDLIVITSTSARSGVNTLFTGVAVPVLTWHSGLMNDLGMTAGTSGTDYGTTSSQTAVAIVGGTHPLTAGLSGSVTVTTQADTFSWGVPNANAIKVATLTGNGTRCAEFAYEAGAAMPGGTAPARRLGIFLTNQTMLYLNASGTKLFDQAVRWTALKPPTNLAAIPGDTRVQLRWTTSATATSYAVKRATIPGGPYTTVASSVNGDRFIDSGLENGKPYYYVVRG
jgi:hypothetical protein